jgi:hypothetical protein
MSICAHDQAIWTALDAVAFDIDVSQDDRKERILTALEPSGDRLPEVNEDSLRRYCRYLSANLLFPFAAHYPRPTSAKEEREFRCYVWELIDPANHLGDEFDGIFCVTRKGKYELKLPLNELDLPEDSPNFRLIEDYRHWFWNWR